MLCKHMLMIVLTMSLLLIAVVDVSQGQEASAAPDPILVTLDARVSQFLEGVSLGQVKSAYQELLAGSQLLKQTDSIKKLGEKTNRLEKHYGRYRAFEQIVAKRIGNDLVLLKYLYKCENFPVVWYFAFYRTPTSATTTTTAAAKDDTWRAIMVRFDTKLEAL